MSFEQSQEGEFTVTKKVKKTVRFLDQILAIERTEVRIKTVSTTGI
jgi:hypothetical protein